MQGIEVLYWALSILFCLALAFAILLWCRTWRREERGETAQQIRALTGAVGRLTASVEVLEHASASLQMADEQMARQLEDLRGIVRVLQAASLPPSGRTPPDPAESRPPASSPSRTDSASETPAPEPEDRYAQARALLLDGRSPLEVARTLDLGTAEVQMIARIIDLESGSETVRK